MLNTPHYLSNKDAQEETELRQLSQRKDLGHFQDHIGAEEPPILQFKHTPKKNQKKKTEKEQSYGCGIMSVLTIGF